jgi:hypothetical protein
MNGQEVMNNKIKWWAAAGLAWVAVAPAYADTGIFGSYVAIDPDGPGAGALVWYGAQQPGPSSLTSFNGLDLGSFVQGSVATIAGAEVLTWKNSGADVTGALLNWTVTGSAFQSQAIGWTADAPFNDAAGNAFGAAGSGDQKWAQLSAPVNFLAGLAPGNHVLTVYLQSTTTWGDRFSSNGGANFSASFKVTSPVPEPSGYGMLAVGLAALMLHLRRRGKA